MSPIRTRWQPNPRRAMSSVLNHSRRRCSRRTRATCLGLLQSAIERHFAVHSVPITFLVNWIEETLGRQVINETDLPGIYGFELKKRVNTPEALIQLLRDGAGLVITRDRRGTPTLIVRQRQRNVKLMKAIGLSQSHRAGT